MEAGSASIPPGVPLAVAQASPEVIPIFPFNLNSTQIVLSAALLIGFLTLSLAARSKRNGRRRIGIAVPAARGRKKVDIKTILLVGPLASGKTALFSKLVYGHAPPTHTSMRENEGIVDTKWSQLTEPAKEDISLSNEKAKPPSSKVEKLTQAMHVIDLPGHPRLRTRSLAQVLPSADGIIFTIDMASGLSGKNVKDAAEHFHILLSLVNLLPSSSTIPSSILILLTKSDLLSMAAVTSSSATGNSSINKTSKSMALTLSRAKQSLSRELERRRLAGQSSSSRLSAGARLEGLEAIPTTSSATSTTGGIGHKLLSMFRLSSLLGGGGSGGLPPSISNGSTWSTSNSDLQGRLPTDEAEVLSTGEAFPFEGEFTWDKLDYVDIQWAYANTKDDHLEGGIDQVWDWKP